MNQSHIKPIEPEQGLMLEIAESQSALRAYITKLVGYGNHVDDIMQNCNLIIWEKRDDWDPETVFLKWAYRIAYFQSKSWIRDKSRDRLHFDEELLEMLSDDEPNYPNASPIQQKLTKCLEAIDPVKKKLLLNRYEPNCSMEQLAEQHQYSVNNLSQVLRRLRIKLSDCIQSQQEVVV